MTKQSPRVAEPSDGRADEADSGALEEPDREANPSRRGRWITWVVGALALVVGVTAGAVAGMSDPTETTQYRSLAVEREKLARQVADLESELAAAEQELGVIDERSAELDEREGALDSREEELDGRSEQLDQRESRLEERADEVTAAEDEAAAREVGEGVWTVGVDIEPGTYRTVEPVSSTCYWGIYRTGSNGEDIVANDIVTGGRPTVTLSEGQDFQSDCGTWRRQ